MASKAHLFFCLLALAGFLVSTHAAKPTPFKIPFNRSSFPSGFIFGSGISSYQSEGATTIDGRGISIWDTFVKEHPEKIADRSTGDVADDFYHRYKEDIKLMKKIGLDSFRFSLSWPRLLPKGKISGGVNPLGVQFYNNLINELLSNGLVPFVTLYHWDLPQTLEDEYGGWLSPKVVEDYKNYTDFCFKTFGDRVKNWVTMNEPNGVSNTGYNTGGMAPGRCSNYVGNCSAGDSATEPYIAGHHYLLAHAAAVKVYKDKYQAVQKGQIGITIVTHWFEPKFNTASSRRAASRALDLMFGWFTNAVTFGDYPQSVKSSVGSRLPKFTEAESKMLKGSIDFLGVNYYTANFAENSHFSNDVNQSYSTDNHANLTTVNKNGAPIGTPTALAWLHLYPKGLRELMLHIKEKYNNPPVYITENGMADANNSSLPVKEAIKDSLRIRYMHGHLSYLLQAIKEGANVKAYYSWSFMDDFEWDAGYTARFGLVFIDYQNNLRRHLKYSAYWFKKFLEK